MQPFTLADIGLNKEKLTLLGLTNDNASMLDVSPQFVERFESCFQKATDPLMDALNNDDILGFKDALRPHVRMLSSVSGMFALSLPDDFKFETIRELIFAYEGVSQVYYRTIYNLQDHPWKCDLIQELQNEIDVTIEKQK